MLLKDVTKYQFYSIQRNQLIWTQYRSVQNMFNLGKATVRTNPIRIVRYVYRTLLAVPSLRLPVNHLGLKMLGSHSHMGLLL